MATKKVKVCGGILLTRSESGTSKIQKVLVETKPGKTKGQVKCRLQKFVKNAFRPSRIPVFIKNHKMKKSVHSSIVNISDNSLSKNEDTSIDPSSKGDWKTDNCEGQGPNLGSKMELLEASCSLKTEEPNEEMVPHLNMADSAVDLLYANENEDFDNPVEFPEDADFEDDKDASIPLRQFQEFNKQKSDKPTIVMTQYSSVLHRPYEGGERRSETESEEDFEAIEASVDSSIYSHHERYIDSGLRRLKSQESRLILNDVTYKSKRKRPTEGGDDDVRPLLTELPSDIFRPPKTPAKTLSSKSIKSPASLSHSESQSSKSLEDEHSEASDIDTGPLDRLKELEDKSYVISTRGGSFEDKDLSKPSSFVRGRDKDGQIRSRSLDRYSHLRDVSVPLIQSVGPSTLSLDRYISRFKDASGPLIDSVGPSTDSRQWREASGPLIDSIGRSTASLQRRDASGPLIDSIGASTDSRQWREASGPLIESMGSSADSRQWREASGPLIDSMGSSVDSRQWREASGPLIESIGSSADSRQWREASGPLIDSIGSSTDSRQWRDATGPLIDSIGSSTSRQWREASDLLVYSVAPSTQSLDRDVSRTSRPLPIKTKSRSIRQSDFSGPLINSVESSIDSLDQGIIRPSGKIRSKNRGQRREVSDPLKDSVGQSTQSLNQDISRHGRYLPAKIRSKDPGLRREVSGALINSVGPTIITPSRPSPAKVRSKNRGERREVPGPLVDSVGPSTQALDRGRPSKSLPVKIKSRDGRQREVSCPSIDSIGPSSESLIQVISRHSGTFPVIGKLSKLVETPSKEFCIHTKDVPDGYAQDFSITSFRPQDPRQPFKSKDDHTRDSPRSGHYSSRSSSHRDKSSIGTIHPSKSQGFSVASIIDNKEARRSKHSKTKKSSKNW